MIKLRKNYLWVLILLVLAVGLLLGAYDVIPEGLLAIGGRAWPGMLVLAGLALLLRGRIPLANVAAVLATIILVGGVTMAAYSTREGEAREDQVVPIEQSVDSNTTLLVVNVSMLATDITVTQEGDRERGVVGEFVGPRASQVDTTLESSASTTHEYTISETKPEQFPALEDVGRGSLELALPGGVAVALNITGESGLATLNLSGLQLERLTLDLTNGDALLTLPAYQPRSLEPSERPGEIRVWNGDLEFFVPDAIDVRVAFDRRGSGIQPEYDSAYIIQVDNVDGILRRDVESADIRQHYDVVIPDGQLSLSVIRDEGQSEAQTNEDQPDEDQADES